MMSEIKIEWSPVTRIKEKIGVIKYKENFGESFEQLLNTNEIDIVLEIIQHTKIFDNDEHFRTILLKHIETYKYAC